MAKLVLGKEIDPYVKCSEQYRYNKAKIYSVALEQCTEAMENHLEGEEKYEYINGELDDIRFLLLIRVCYTLDE